MRLLSSLAFAVALSSPGHAAAPAPLAGQEEAPDREDLRSFGRVIGLEFSDAELDQLLPDVLSRLPELEALRLDEEQLPNSVFPALVFDPLLPGMAPRPRARGQKRALTDPAARRPTDLSELYFADIATLSGLIREREVSCEELTVLFLERLESLDPHLLCVTQLLPDRALARARELDRELAEGRWRGPLHGIPWGAKDLLAVEGTLTTYGAQPFRGQELEGTATVVQRLDDAGAVLVAKLTLGALAMGDVWYGGRTRNPWNLEQGSSGSSAGSAAAVAAGALPFALGTETLGSIVSPATRCGVSGLRPTFGRVSRAGAMALVWSMDKIGPITRSAADAAVVLEAIQGPDELDPTVHDQPFDASLDVDIAGMVVGVPVGAFGEGSIEEAVLAELEALEVVLVDLELPEYPLDSLLIGLSVEAAAAFDALTRDGRDDELVRQGRGAWPGIFRAARLVPAVEFLNAQRLRTQLMRDLDRALAEVDMLVHPSYAAGVLTMTNLTGHPTFVAPIGEPIRAADGEFRALRSVSFTGHLFDEERLLAVARAWQESTGHDEERPGLEFLDASPTPRTQDEEQE